MDIIAHLPFGRIRIDSGPGVEYRLRENHPLRLSQARGQQLLCTSGCAWITALGMADDVFLHAGETWRVSSDGLVLIEAVGEGAIAINPALG